MQYLFSSSIQQKAIEEETESFVLTPKEKRKIRKSIQASVAMIHQLHANLLQLIDKWAKIEKQRAESVVIRPPTPISDDPLLTTLQNHPAFIQLCQTYPFDFSMYMVEEWYTSYLSHPYATKARPQAAGSLMEHLVKYFFKVEGIQAECQKRDICWEEDRNIVYRRIRRFIDLFPQAPEKSFALYEERLPADKEDFYVKLVEKTLTSIEKHDQQLKAFVENWSFERINPLDQTLIRMTLTEISDFPHIPAKVSINEYLDIAKAYSTPKSSAFINGVADKIAKFIPNA